MGSGRAISQLAFEEVVRENMDDLSMDPDEALEDAIQTLTLQGVDLSGIVKCVPGSAKENPIMRVLHGLKSEGSSSDETAELLEELIKLCSTAGSENASLAARNGGVDLLCSLCSGLRGGPEQHLLLGLIALRALLLDVQSTESFRHSGGPKIIVEILNENTQNDNILDSVFSIIAAAATGNEVVKELFMDLKIDEFVLQILKRHSGVHNGSLYDAICVLLTADDNRVVASQVFGYARRFAKIGISDVLVDALRGGLSESSFISVCTALKAIAVNDEICRSVSENGGIDVMLKCINENSEQCNKAVAKACCSLLAKLAGSDANKNAIVQKGGLDFLVNLSSKFSDDPSVLQEIMPIICSLSLRSPDNAARAIEAGAGEMAVQAMKRFPAAYQMQKQSCLMIRNLVVRNPENRTILLGMGIERLIRKAKNSHESCKDAAAAALRDLGFDDYNS